MKLTTARLKQLIREELSRINESSFAKKQLVNDLEEIIASKGIDAAVQHIKSQIDQGLVAPNSVTNILKEPEMFDASPQALKAIQKATSGVHGMN